MTIQARNSGLVVTNTAQIVCTASSGNASLAKLWIANSDGVNTHPVNLSFYDSSAGLTYNLLTHVPIYGRQMRQFVMPLALESGDYITASSDSSNSLHITSAIYDYINVSNLSIKNAAVTPNDNQSHVFYVCPHLTTASVRLLAANNDQINRQTVTITWNDYSHSTSYLAALNIPIDPMVTYEFDIPLILEAQDSIALTVSNANTLTVFASIEVMTPSS